MLSWFRKLARIFRGSQTGKTPPAVRESQRITGIRIGGASTNNENLGDLVIHRIKKQKDDSNI